MTSAGLTVAGARGSGQGRSPGLLRNPIFGRELITLLRSHKSFLFLAVYLLGSAAFLLVAWPKGGGPVSLQGELSREVFFFFALAQTLLVAVVVPATLAPSVTGEKERETLDLLLTTPLRPPHIFLGKLLSGTLYLLLLMAASMPVLLFCYVLGGLRGSDILGLYLFLAVLALVAGSVSLTLSIFLHRTHKALVASYVSVAVLTVGALLLYGDGIGFLTDKGGPALALWTATVVIAVCYLASSRRLGRPFDPVQVASAEAQPTNPVVSLFLHPEAWPDRWLLPKRTRGVLADGKNVVYHKEGVAELYAAGTGLVRILIQFGALGSLVVMIWAAVQGTMTNHVPEWYYITYLVAYIAMLAPAFAATAFTQEKEQGTIESLLLTLLPARQIVAGKGAFVVRTVGLLTLFNTVCLFELSFLITGAPQRLLALATTVFPVLLFATALGMLYSLYLRTTLSATIATYSTLACLFLGPALVGQLAERLVPQFAPVARLVAFASPLTAADDCISPVLTGFLLAASIGIFAVTILRFEPVLKRQLGEL